MSGRCHINYNQFLFSFRFKRCSHEGKFLGVKINGMVAQKYGDLSWGIKNRHLRKKITKL